MTEEVNNIEITKARSRVTANRPAFWTISHVFLTFSESN